MYRECMNLQTCRKLGYTVKNIHTVKKDTLYLSQNKPYPT